MFTAIWTYFESWYRSEDGAAMVEYGLLVALIAVLGMGTLLILGGSLDGMFQAITSQLSEWAPE